MAAHARSIGSGSPQGQYARRVTQPLESALSRARSFVRRQSARRRAARRSPPVDPNFVGFDKYERNGAYHWREIEQSPDYRAKADFIRDRLAGMEEVLDLGCGDGAYMGHLASRCSSITGIDAEGEAIHLASNMFHKLGIENARAVEMPLSRVDLESLGRAKPFDLVYSMDVIEHLPHPEEMGERVLRVTHASSMVVVGTPKFLGEALVSPYHCKEFESDELLALLSAYLTDMDLHELPMRRSDDVVHEDGFLVVVGRPGRFG